MKTFHKLGIEGNFIPRIKGTYEKQLVRRLIVKDWLLFHLDQEQDKIVHSCHTYSTLYYIMSKNIRQGKEIKGIHIGKEK